MLREKIIAAANNRKVQKTALILLGMVLLVFFLQMYHKANRVGGYDFTSFIYSAKALLNGQNPYKTISPFPYIYPMFFAALLIPLAVLPYWLANLLWFWLNIVFLFLSVKIIVELVAEYFKIKLSKVLILPLVVSFFLLLNLIQNNLLNGQVNLLVLFLCVLFIKYYLEKKEITAAVCLSAAISIKLVPAVFLLFLLLRRRFLSLLIVTALVFVFCFLVPYAFLRGEFIPIFMEYINNFIIGSLAGTKNAADMFFNIKDLMFYLKPDLSYPLFIRIFPLLAVFVPLIVLELFNLKKVNKYSELLVFNLYLLSVLLYSPISETHHLVLLIPVVCLAGLIIIFNKKYFKLQMSLPYLAFFVCLILGKIVKYGPFYIFAIFLLYYIVTRLIVDIHNNKRTNNI